MTPAQLAFVAGSVWIDSGLRHAPGANRLASVACDLDPDADSLAVVRACVEVAEHVAWVLRCRANMNPSTDVPRW